MPDAEPHSKIESHGNRDVAVRQQSEHIDDLLVETRTAVRDLVDLLTSYSSQSGGKAAEHGA